MDLNTFCLQQAEPEFHFGAMAKLASSVETEPTTEASLHEWYAKRVERGIRFDVAVNHEGEVGGYSCLYRDNMNLEGQYGMDLVVESGLRQQGLGSMLYDHLVIPVEEMDARRLMARVRDTCAEGIRFATQRGFVQKKHSLEMRLELETWDDRRFTGLLESLQAQGFRFTNMAELGDTQVARQNLYKLNNGAAATDPGSDGIAPWSTFEEFELDVCRSKWYRPEGQIIAIDTRTGVWAAMSAITVFEGADHAYNLFTGTHADFRGRKLAQAVKTLALRKARSFGVGAVRTSHNSENAVMIAIDTKLGYVRTPGVLIMQKELGG